MSFAHYLLQVNIYLIVFYIAYKMLLARETYFTLNRIYLVASGILSVLIPFIRIEWLIQQKTAQQVYAGTNWKTVLEKATVMADYDAHFTWPQLILTTYFIGTLFCSARFLLNLYKLKKYFVPKKQVLHFHF